MTRLGVAIVTTGRCPQLLGEIIEAWARRGVRCEVVVNVDVGRFAHDANEAMDRVEAPFCMQSADDVLPVGEWPDVWNQPLDSIKAVRCLDVEGRRAFEWARWRGDEPYERGILVGYQRVDEPADAETYISGHCQVWGPEARSRLRHRGVHAAIDIRVCRDAWEDGIRLLPPDPSPLLIHLERRFPK